MAHPIRRRFRVGLLNGLRVIWPVLAVLFTVMAGLGAVIAVIERWPLTEGLYFAFVTGLTIGYGDVVPKAPMGRLLAIAIGFTGIVVGGLVAAITVQALHAALDDGKAH